MVDDLRSPAAAWPLPARQAPAAAQLRSRFDRRASQVVAQHRIERLYSRFPLIAATFLSKISMPPFGAMGLALTTPLMLAVAFAGFVSGQMVLHVRRALVFGVMLAVMMALQVVAADFSLGSLALLTVVHMPYIFQMRRQERPRDGFIEYFQGIVVVLGIVGIVQYGAQFVIGPVLAFPMEHLVPAQLTIAKFNSTGLLQYGSSVMRSNGVFMIEPSIFSQLMAVGVIMEILTRKRLAYFAVMGLAILVSYSGTGLMLLMACLAFEAVVRQRWDILITAAVMGSLLVLLGIAADIPMITNILGRSGEFGAAGSSGSMRFVGGFQLFDEYLWTDTFRALFGYGAGTLATYAGKSTMPLAEMFLFKVIFEYGLVGAGAFFGFLGYCVLTAPVPGVLRVAVAMSLLLGGMYTPFGHCLACGLLLWRKLPRPDETLRWARHA